MTEIEAPGVGDELLRLASADNFRDVAGPGYPTTDGATCRRGVFYRCNELQLTEAEIDMLSGLSLTHVIDLRTQPEVDRHPDPEVPGAGWLHFDVIGIPMGEVALLETREAASALMDRVYRGFVDSPLSREALGRLFRQLATGGPQLFHCTAGKDRTGWVAALLLHIAGVDDATIDGDYLQTNLVSAGSRTRAERAIAARLGHDRVDVFEPTLVADVDYLRAGYDAVKATYGDRAGYLRDGLGLSDEVVRALRSLLREE